MTEGPDSGLWVDQFEAFVDEAVQFRLQVVRGEGDVVEPAAGAGDEAPDPGVGRERLDQFESGTHEADPYALFHEGLHRGTGVEREGLVKWERRLDRLDGECDVMQWKSNHQFVPDC